MNTIFFLILLKNLYFLLDLSLFYFCLKGHCSSITWTTKVIVYVTSQVDPSLLVSMYKKGKRISKLYKIVVKSTKLHVFSKKYKITWSWFWKPNKGVDFGQHISLFNWWKEKKKKKTCVMIVGPKNQTQDVH